MFTPDKLKKVRALLQGLAATQVQLWESTRELEATLGQDYDNIADLVAVIASSYTSPEQLPMADTEEFLKQLETDGPLCSN